MIVYKSKNIYDLYLFEELSLYKSDVKYNMDSIKPKTSTF